jgi:hypothetical protein
MFAFHFFEKKLRSTFIGKVDSYQQIYATCFYSTYFPPQFFLKWLALNVTRLFAPRPSAQAAVNENAGLFWYTAPNARRCNVWNVLQNARCAMKYCVLIVQFKTSWIANVVSK